MLDLIGLDYVKDLWLQTIEQIKKEQHYRSYITDLLILGVQAQAHRQLNIPRYMDVIEPKARKKKVVENPKKTADEIIANISGLLDRLGNA